MVDPAEGAGPASILKLEYDLVLVLILGGTVIMSWHWYCELILERDSELILDDTGCNVILFRTDTYYYLVLLTTTHHYLLLATSTY